MSAKNSLGDQFIRVFHSSIDETPVHLMDSAEYLGYIKGTQVFKSNPRGNLIFAGTENAARSRIRPYIHKYDIPVSMIRPEIWGDDMKFPDDPIYAWGKNGEPPQLWETLPADTSLVTPHSVLQFRNAVEDYGSISHVFHKNSVNNRLIRYAGMEKVDNG
jgi:hypothetical protein